MLKKLFVILLAFMFTAPAAFAASSGFAGSSVKRENNRAAAQTASRDISQAIHMNLYTDYGKKMPDICKNTADGIALAAAFANTPSAASISAARTDTFYADGFAVQGFSYCKTACTAEFDNRAGASGINEAAVPARKAVSFLTGYMGLLRLLGSESFSAAKYLNV